MLDRILKGNQRFVREVFEKNRTHYQELLRGQHPELLWIGCSDSRVSVSHITDTQPGAVFVHRNVANMVSFNDNNFGAVLAYALDHLEIRDVVVCGHNFCGGLAALVHGNDSHVIQDWLNIAGAALRQVEELDPEAKLDSTTRMELLTEYHVLLQIKHLEQFALVRAIGRQVRAEDPSLKIHGLVYDFRTGRLHEVPEDPGSRVRGPSAPAGDG